MTHKSRLHLRPIVVFVAAVLLVAVGAAATYLVMRRTVPAPAHVAGATTTSTAAPESKHVPSAAAASVTLSPDAIDRAGIVLQPVSAQPAAGRLRLPGTVQPNTYRTTAVTSIVGGRITRVNVELGQTVRTGQTLAEIYSPELADAQTRFVASRAELDAHERELRRTEKLVELGSASRQELERIHAAHTAALTAVQSHRSRLTLLGMSDGQLTKLAAGTTVTATISIPSPLDGVVTTREANAGMNVDPSAKLFTVSNLSTVWIVGDLNERDLSRVRVGSPAIVSSTALPELMREAKVSYIDPQIKSDTRTAQLRVEIPNPGGQLRLGMYVDLEVGGTQTSTAVAVPRSAMQIVGNRSVVYVGSRDQPGQFVERFVETGQTVGDMIEIRSGVKPGEMVVATGSFAVRAEAERVGMGATSHSHAASQPDVPEPRVIVSEKGFEPSRVTLRLGVPARVTFVRTTDVTCATEVAIPSLKIKRTLPLNEPVTIELPSAKAGDIAFVCGMNMFRGTLVIE
ncbi:MAG TPA: efflux RND transporter periplasmic adaptor subunit [Vicinamibacterales bacterium]|nr:efflux RND transporter periplasmic adaptor subunit [Vicinamibacterales bacterium]